MEEISAAIERMQAELAKPRVAWEIGFSNHRENPYSVRNVVSEEVVFEVAPKLFARVRKSVALKAIQPTPDTPSEETDPEARRWAERVPLTYRENRAAFDEFVRAWKERAEYRYKRQIELQRGRRFTELRDGIWRMHVSEDFGAESTFHFWWPETVWLPDSADHAELRRAAERVLTEKRKLLEGEFAQASTRFVRMLCGHSLQEVANAYEEVGKALRESTTRSHRESGQDKMLGKFREICFATHRLPTKKELAKRCNVIKKRASEYFSALGLAGLPEAPAHGSGQNR